VGNAFLVSAVAATADRFIAVGAEPSAGQDLDGVRQGVVWTSADGLTWDRATNAEFAGATLLHAVNLDGDVYLLGYVSDCPVLDDECAGQADAGMAVWSGRDDGERGWQAHPLSQTLRAGQIDGCAAAAGRLACFGSEGEEVVATLWLSNDGSDWQRSTELAEMDPISALAAGGPGMVAFGTQYDLGTDTIATRAGASGNGTTFEAAALPADLAVAIDQVTDGPAGLVAVGYRDDPATGAATGAVLRSTDGLGWSGGPEPAFAGVRVQLVHALAGGYLVIGSVPDSPSDSSAPVAAWFSSDGVSWTALGSLGNAPVSEIAGAATTSAGVVVFGVDYGDDISQAGTVHAWFAPLDGIAP
jgi:hypothetical protein